MTPDRERRYIVEIETLQEENRQLKEMLTGMDRDTNLAKIMSHFRVTPGEGKMLLAMYHAKGKTVTREGLLRAADAAEEVDPKGVDVRMHKLRNKVGRPGIVTVWAHGYHLTPEAHKKVHAVLAPEEDLFTRL